jgi:hypothetical protein
MDLDSNGGLLSDGPLIRLIGHCVLAFAALLVLRHMFARLLVAVFVVIGASLGPRFVICPYRKIVPRLYSCGPSVAPKLYRESDFAVYCCIS